MNCIDLNLIFSRVSRFHFVRFSEFCAVEILFFLNFKMDIIYHKLMSPHILNKENEVNLGAMEVVSDSQVAESVNRCIMKLYGKYLSEDG